MTKSKVLFVILATLSLTLYSTRTSGLDVTTLNWSCLSREQKQDIAICFEQNSECHKALEKATAPQVQDSWEDLLLAGLLGVGAGVVIDNQMRKH